MTRFTAALTAMLATLAPTALTQTARPAIPSVSHLSIYTTDAEKTERYYVHDLGGVKRPDPQNPKGVRYYFNPAQFVEVLPLPPDAAPKLRFDHAGYNTANAEQMRRYLAEHRVEVPAEVTKGSDGSQYFYVRDPEGNRVQFIQPPPNPAPVTSDALSNHIIHVGYIIHSIAVQDAFYIGLLGFRPYWHGGKTEDSSDWTSMQMPDGRDWLEYMKVQGPETTGIPAAMSQDNAGVLDHFALGVQNMEQSMNLLYAGDRLNNKHSQPQIGRDGKWQLNMYDPDGIRAELMEFQPSVKPCCSPFLQPSPTK